jgi:Uncharacterized protein conserved in bacteria (DUF2332)
MAGVEPAVGTAENYRRFARFEAAGRSPVYEALALEVAEEAGLLAFLDTLPAAKRQPNLLFAAAPPARRATRARVASTARDGTLPS